MALKSDARSHGFLRFLSSSWICRQVGASRRSLRSLSCAYSNWGLQNMEDGSCDHGCWSCGHQVIFLCPARESEPLQTQQTPEKKGDCIAGSAFARFWISGTKRDQIVESSEVRLQACLRPHPPKEGNPKISRSFYSFRQVWDGKWPELNS